ncbi:YidB family protein [Streptomyces sp. NPDC057499]|uniref:YidB family protein n=1 Tax=Streptomyces sp. NPDC057499 TaxID=3346150 RepID=UPI0036B21D80
MSESELSQSGGVPAVEPIALTLPQVASWVGPGVNEPVTAAEIAHAIGEEGMGRLASTLGKNVAEAAEYLALALPRAADAATSEGPVTPGGARGVRADDTLLMLFDQIPDQVTFREPETGISFGLGG